jgi:hypothetical protein
MVIPVSVSPEAAGEGHVPPITNLSDGRDRVPVVASDILLLVMDVLYEIAPMEVPIYVPLSSKLDAVLNVIEFWPCGS